MKRVRQGAPEFYKEGQCRKKGACSKTSHVVEHIDTIDTIMMIDDDTDSFYILYIHKPNSFNLKS